ncbi:hypothetical protein F5Y05DRAFT_412898 [Hypoxylon sp. FL0543]|nr:hypothetical protein F5Y05DRAFT_412898 [Hypoxylon sp. FL0543]
MAEYPEARTVGLSRSGLETASCVAPEYTNVKAPHANSRLNKFVLPAWIADMSYPKFDETVSSDLTAPKCAGRICEIRWLQLSATSSSLPIFGAWRSEWATGEPNANSQYNSSEPERLHS